MWGPPIGLMVAIFTVSSVPHLDTSRSGLSDKSLHAWTYGLLGLLLLRALARARWAAMRFRTACAAWLVAVVYGVFDELHQGLVPGREPSIADWLADARGAAVGVLAGLVFAVVWRRSRGL